MKIKKVNVSNETWLRMTKDKYNLGLKTLEDVILRLYEISTQIKKAGNKK